MNHCEYSKEQYVAGKHSGVAYIAKKLTHLQMWRLKLATSGKYIGTYTTKTLWELFSPVLALDCPHLHPCKPEPRPCGGQFELREQFVHKSSHTLGHITKIIDVGGFWPRYCMSCDGSYVYDHNEILQDYTPVISVQELDD